MYAQIAERTAQARCSSHKQPGLRTCSLRVDRGAVPAAVDVPPRRQSSSESDQRTRHSIVVQLQKSIRRILHEQDSKARRSRWLSLPAWCCLPAAQHRHRHRPPPQTPVIVKQTVVVAADASTVVQTQVVEVVVTATPVPPTAVPTKAAAQGRRTPSCSPCSRSPTPCTPASAP